MNELVKPSIEQSSLPAMVDRAAKTLAGARNSAEILEAHDMASVAYDAAKTAARIARAKSAHDDLIQRVYRAQADALDIEAQAKRRLADEYDAAQERGEVGQSGSRTDLVPNGNEVKPTAADIGLSRKQIHEARIVRDAEAADPGIVRRTTDSEISAGRAPTRAAVRRAAKEATGHETTRPRRGKDAICLKVREAISLISGLPPALTVIEYVRDTDHAILIDEQIEAASEWMNEFSNSWSKIDD